MEFSKLVIVFLLILSIGYAHREGAELRFINGYIVEFHAHENIEFSIIDESAGPVLVAPFVEIYKNGVLWQTAMTSDRNEDGYYYVANNLTPGRYEIRPIFSVGNKVISARFHYEQKGNIIDQIISFLLRLFTKEKTTDLHEHADFALYLNGEKVNFSQEKYMENHLRPLSELAHFHDMNGNVIHKHAAGVTMGHFLGTLGVKFNATCVSAENKTYCSPVNMYVNGIENSQLGQYEFSDLDRILITVGNYTEEQTAEMISSVSDEACIQSGKCPERGSPTDESSCTSSGGCALT